MAILPCKKRNMAGFLTQMKIILWKNTILYYRNLTGLLSEIFLAALFTWIIMIVISSTEEDDSKPITQFRESSILENFGQDFPMDTIYYYPPSSLTDKLMQNVLETIKKNNYQYNRISYVESTNVSEIFNNINNTDSSLHALISFSSSISNMTDWPDVINYTIYLKKRGISWENFSNKFRMNPKDIYGTPIDICTRTTAMDKLEIQFNELKHMIDTNIINIIANSDSLISKV